MRKIKNLVIGGIENKVFNLILLTVILVAVAFSFVAVRYNERLVNMSRQNSSRQQEEISKTTEELMEAVIDRTLSRDTALEARIADDMFSGLENRVRMLGDYAARLLSGEQSSKSEYSMPDPANDGAVTAQVMYAGRTDPDDPELIDRLSAVADMSNMMVIMYGASDETNSCFIALPEGAFLVVDDRSASKFDENGVLKPYDPVTRPWYIQAVEEGGLIFTDVEVDAFTGDIGIVCAMPVYVDGELVAVVGSDLFLTSMKNAIDASEQDGGFSCVINQNGHVVFSPETDGIFAVRDNMAYEDLRFNENAEFAAFVNDALKGSTEVRRIKLGKNEYFMAGASVESVGWALVTVYESEITSRPIDQLTERTDALNALLSEEYNVSVRRARLTGIVLLIAITVFMLTGALVLSKRIVKPLNTITKRISEINEENLEFKMEDTYRTGDEIEVLAEAFAHISHRTVEYVKQVQTVTAEKERISTELSLATQIQESVMPHVFPPYPDRKEFDLYAHMSPAREVGGDFYDFFFVDDDHLCMVMADVSGKGVPAALFMMVSKVLLQTYAMMGLSPAEILAKTNAALCSNNQVGMFVTVWLGVLEISTGKLTAANAGHEYPVIYRKGGAFEIYKDRHGFVIGGMEGSLYRQYELTFGKGDKLFLYTDGVPEANDSENRLFGNDNMLAALNSRATSSPGDILSAVRRAVDKFVGEAEQFDDLTMLCFEYRGTGEEDA